MMAPIIVMIMMVATMMMMFKMMATIVKMIMMMATMIMMTLMVATIVMMIMIMATIIKMIMMMATIIMMIMMYNAYDDGNNNYDDYDGCGRTLPELLPSESSSPRTLSLLRPPCVLQSILSGFENKKPQDFF